MLLVALDPGRYTASGAYQPELAPMAGLPLQWTATFSREGVQAVFDGIYRHYMGGADHPFRLDLTLPSELLGRGHFELQCPHFDLTGVFRVVGSGIVFAGRSEEKGISVTLNLEVLKPGTLDAKGVLFRPKEAPWFFWFSASEVPTQQAKANVVGLHTRQG